MTEPDEYPDPEETAANLAARAYLRVMAAEGSKFLALAAGGVGVIAADWAFLVMALWRVPRLAAGALIAFVAFELTRMIVSARKARREARSARDRRARMTRDEAERDITERLQREVPPPRWRAGPRSLAFWEWIAFRLIYSGCAAIVFSGWTGIIPGIALTAAYTALVMATGLALQGSARGLFTAAAFSGLAEPRDSPELSRLTRSRRRPWKSR